MGIVNLEHSEKQGGGYRDRTQAGQSDSGKERKSRSHCAVNPVLVGPGVVECNVATDRPADAQVEQPEVAENGRQDDPNAVPLLPQIPDQERHHEERGAVGRLPDAPPASTTSPAVFHTAFRLSVRLLLTRAPFGSASATVPPMTQRFIPRLPTTN